MVLELPEIENYKDSDYEVAERMLTSLWRRFANNAGATSLPYWLDQFSSQNEGNRMILRLAEDKWITTSVRYNYADIQLNKAKLMEEYSQEELDEIIVDTKMEHYKPITSSPSLLAGATDVKLPSGIQKTGLVRMGFSRSGSHKFKYDTSMLMKYRKQITQVSVKAMIKLEEKLGYSLRIDGAYDYESIIRHVILEVMQNPDQEYNLGKLTLDSRGRAIYQALKTVFNPIANKMARALVVAPPATVDNEDILFDTYLFIAELVHGFEGDIEKKFQIGKQAYADRIMATDNLEDVDDLFENIWLERMYADLDAWYADNTHQFTTPIEVDFSASNMTIIGLLLGHSDYIDHTRYMWEIDGLSKLHIKKAQTPYVFGSSAPITKLWKKANLTWTSDQVKLMKFHQTHGKFAIANEFKDIIINYCTPQEHMMLHVADEKFTVECNRYKHVGDTTKQYIVYNTESDKLSVIRHTTTHKVPDLSQFKRFFVTAIIHNLDSQGMNRIVKPLDWNISIHDAAIVTVVEARKTKDLAAEWMQEIYDNRRSILLNYFKSIGLTDEGYARFVKLEGKIKEFNKGKEMTITPWLLK